MSVAAEDMITDVTLRKQTRDALASLTQILKDARTYTGELRKVVERIVTDAGIIDALQAEGTDESASRIENIQELFGVVSEFATTHEDEEAFFEAPTAEAGEEPQRELRGDSLADFIEWVRLRTDLDAVDEDGDAITLMTIHAAKGLEFDYVYVAGLEEGVFPNMSHSRDDRDVEEERRLAYVAITRARKKLTLTCAQTRQLYGQTNANPPSRFIREIPENLRETSGLGSAGFEGTGWEKRGSRRGIAGSGVEAGGGRVFGQSSASGAGGRTSRRNVGAGAGIGKREGAKETFKPGDNVDHKTFGRGHVVKVDGDTILVKFNKTGQTKKLLKDFAPIVKIK
jgi:DNA helicase-2/ATP-dependent DNA helicase PcrA